MKKFVLIGVAVMFVGFAQIASFAGAGYVGYKIGYKKGLSDMAQFATRYFAEQHQSGDTSEKPKSDEETGNAGHFGPSNRSL